MATDPRIRACTIPVATVDTVQACLDRSAVPILPKPSIPKDLLWEIHAALDDGKPVA